jgi:hypothetical protein
MFYAAVTFFASIIVDLLTLLSTASFDTDLEILALRHPFLLLQRQLNAKLRCSRVEKLLLAVLTAKLKAMFNRQSNR